MRRYLEHFFRHRILLSLPLLVAVVAGLAFSLTAARTFSSAANLWCDVAVPEASSLQKPVPAGQNTPSADTLPVIEEFLQTQSFNVAVVKRTPLAGYLTTHSQFLGNQLADRLAKQVKVAIIGPQVLSVTVKADSAVLAASLAKGVVAEFIDERARALQQRDQTLVSYYQKQFDSGAAALAVAEEKLGAYVVLHPSTPTLSDPRASQLGADVAGTQQQQATRQSQLTQAQLDLTHAGDANALHIIDAPLTPIRPDGRMKQLLLGAIGGLLAGLVITILTLVLLVVVDGSVRQESEVASMLSLQLVGSVEQFPTGTLPGRDRRRRFGRKKPEAWRTGPGKNREAA